jgi:hypothetical protein
MFFNDQAARNPQVIANLFANFFQEVYVKEDDSLSFLNNVPIDESNSHKLSLIQFTEPKIKEAILRLDGLDGSGT